MIVHNAQYDITFINFYSQQLELIAIRLLNVITSEIYKSEARKDLKNIIINKYLNQKQMINDFKFKIIKGNKIIPISEENLRKCFDKVYDAAKGTYVKDTSLESFTVVDSSKESSSVKDSSAGVSSGEDSFVEDVFREDKVPFRKRIVTFFTEHF